MVKIRNSHFSTRKLKLAFFNSQLSTHNFPYLTLAHLNLQLAKYLARAAPIKLYFILNALIIYFVHNVEFKKSFRFYSHVTQILLARILLSPM
jgi:hypothetical protein